MPRSLTAHLRAVFAVAALAGTAAVPAANRSRGVRVIGAGLSRTATQSLAVALQQLGIRTLHAEGFHPEMPLGSGNALVSTVYEAAIAYVAAMSPALELVEEMGVEAVVDLPSGTELVPHLLQRYPDAKVVVTVRDSAAKWYRSYWEHFRWASVFPPCFTHPFVTYWRDITASTGCGFLTRFPPRFPAAERLACMAAYDEHLELMRRIVPEEQLLVFNVREGWEPLARFLGLQPPECRPFPRTDAYSVHWRCTPGVFCLTVYLVYACVLALLCGAGICGFGCLRRWIGQSAKRKQA